MKTNPLLLKILLALSLIALPALATGQTPPAGPSGSSIEKEMRELVGKIQNKITGGARSEEQFAEELKEFDELIQRHSDEKTDEVANAAFMRAMLYVQIFHNQEKGMELIKQLKSDFPETTPGKRADGILASLERRKAAEKTREGLQVGAPFPDFNEEDLNADPLSISKFKGKVVLVDFWATWCGPCITELPNVLDAYKKYHGDGFEIVGISLDKDRDKLTSFMKKEGMTWPQYFDGKGWENKLAGKYGVTSIPATYPLDTEGKIAAKDLRGEELSKEVARLLEK